jgi:signal-transduction protein with cAMP-binding, CBS, and nucleotidyltransferase domain
MKTAQDILNQKATVSLFTVAPQETVKKAIEMMVAKKVGAILVAEEDRIIGIWTERDLLNNMTKPSFNPETDPVRNYMSSPLRKASHDTPLVVLEEMFLGLFIRHILVEKDNQYVGLLSIGDVIRTSLLEKDEKIKELNSIASWQYYEDWCWKKKS